MVLFCALLLTVAWNPDLGLLPLLQKFPLTLGAWTAGFVLYKGLDIQNRCSIHHIHSPGINDIVLDAKDIQNRHADRIRAKGGTDAEDSRLFASVRGRLGKGSRGEFGVLMEIEENHDSLACFDVLASSHVLFVDIQRSFHL